MEDKPKLSLNHASRTRILTYGIVLFGTILNLLFIVPNGDYFCQKGVCGIYIGEWHYHDALWHIAVARNSFQSFPFIFPSAAGFHLTSYNYLLGALLSTLEFLRISPFFSYFKLLPIVGNVALVYTLFRYFRLTHKSTTQQLWISLFMYFGSSFSYLLILYRNNFSDFSILKGFPVVATLQPAFVLSNVQFFLTIPILLYIFTDICAQTNTKNSRVVHALLLSLVIGLKIYSGFFVLFMLFVGLFRNALRTKQMHSMFISSAFYVFVSSFSICLFYLPFYSYSDSLPFIMSISTIPHQITEVPSLFYHKEFTLGRYYMLGLKKISPRLILYETISATLFILWNLGTRLIFVPVAIFTVIKRKMKFEEAVLGIMGIVGLLIPIFFIQKSGGWYNSIQFAYVGVYLLGILGGIYVAKIWASDIVILRIVVATIVLLSLPNNILTLKLIAKEKLVIPDTEIQALSYLRQQSPGVVLSFPDYKNSSYVPALSGKVGYMIDY
ncbi:hypothetical protein KBB12_01705 [Candidatus Woesebacteria bacterium]|nr:hypothetical protein [Candidatus Woesebacteria bacterium]